MKEVFKLLNEPKKKILISSTGHNMNPNRKGFCRKVGGILDSIVIVC